MGQMNALAQLFTQSRYLNAPHGIDEEVRERVLNEAYNPLAWTVTGQTLLLVILSGRVIAEPKEVQGCKIVNFDFYPASSWDRLTFWMNASSVKDLGDHIRTLPEKRVTPEVILTIH